MYSSSVYLPTNFLQIPPQSQEDAKYSFDKIERSADLIIQPKILNPENTGTYSTAGNKIIRFELPTSGCYNFQEAVLYISLRINNTPALVAPFKALPNGVWNIFSRVRHLNGTQVVEDRDDCNVISNFWWMTQQDPTFTESAGIDLFGFGTQAERNARGLVDTRYSVPYPLNFLTATPMVPLEKWEKQYIEFYLAEPNTYLETNGTNNVVEVFQVEWHINQVISPSKTQELYDAVDQGKYSVAFDGWQLFQNTPLTINNNLIISQRSHSFRGVFTTFFQGNDTNNTNPGYDKLWTYPKLGCNNFQFRILGDLYPELPVDCTGLAFRDYIEYLKWIECYKANGIAKYVPNIGIDDFNTSNFIIVGNFLNDNALVGKPCVLSNVSTAKMSQDLQLNVRFDVSPPAGYVSRHYIFFSYVVTCPPKGRPFSIQF